MTEPSNEAVEALAQVMYAEPANDPERKIAIAGLEAALPIERNRWEQEVRERLLSREARGVAALWIAKQRSRKYYAPQTLEEAYPSEKERAIALGNAMTVLHHVSKAIFGEAEPVEPAEGHDFKLAEKCPMCGKPVRDVSTGPVDQPDGTIE